MAPRPRFQSASSPSGELCQLQASPRGELSLSTGTTHYRSVERFAKHCASVCASLFFTGGYARARKLAISCSASVSAARSLQKLEGAGPPVLALVSCQRHSASRDSCSVLLFSGQMLSSRDTRSRLCVCRSLDRKAPSPSDCVEAEQTHRCCPAGSRSAVAAVPLTTPPTAARS